MTEVEKLAKFLEDINTENIRVTTSYSLGLTDVKPTAEEIAGEINRVHEWLSDPVNNLTSRIMGLVGMKKDTISCTENRTRLIDKEPYFVPVPMTREEINEVRDLKEDVELFEAAVAMIERLNKRC